MKWVNSIIAIIIIIFGSTLMSITIENDTLQTIAYKIVGILFLAVGVVYLKNVVKFGRPE